MKVKIPLVSPGTEKTIGVDLRPPGLGFHRIKTIGASENLENLHISLTYVYKCDGRLVDAISRFWAWPSSIASMGC
jgi:hypothetical protein